MSKTKTTKRNTSVNKAKPVRSTRSKKKSFNPTGWSTKNRLLIPFIVLFALVGSYFIYQSFAATPNATEKMGVFRGAQSPSSVAAFEAWAGRPVTYALGFYGKGSGSFSQIDDPGAKCRVWAPTKYSLVLSTAILPSASYTLAAGANGDYNTHWKNFGQKLVDNGCADITLRLGWEFNGKFYDWAAGGKEADYAAYWRQIVTTLRGVPGQSFRFDWCPLAGNTNANVEAAYPGDAYVDIIGLDAYDTSSVHTSDLDRWNNQVNRTYGLKWQKDFATAHGKSISYPEWGLTVRPNDNLGGGDNPYYIQKMYDWMNALPSSGGGSLAYQSYFEDDAVDGQHALMNGQFPNSAAVFKKLFGVLPATSTTDTTAPSAPSNLAANAISQNQINLTWSASTDNKAVSSYDIYRNGAKVSSSLTPSFSDSGLTAGTSYSYYIIARDAAGNSSTASNTASATTASATVTTSYKTSSFSATLNKYNSKTFSLSLPKAATIKYTVNNSKASGRFDVAIIDPSGKTVQTTSNATLQINDSFTITSTGTYKFKVTTQWWSNNSFTLKVTYPY